MLRELKTFMMFYKVGYEDVLLVVSAMGKPNALEVVIKIIDKSSALQSSVQEVKYHNQVLLDLFEDDTNAVLLQ
jgi:aspartate kinase